MLRVGVGVGVLRGVLLYAGLYLLLEFQIAVKGLVQEILPEFRIWVGGRDIRLVLMVVRVVGLGRVNGRVHLGLGGVCWAGNSGTA